MRDAVIVEAIRTPVGKRNGRSVRRAPGRPVGACAAIAGRSHRRRPGLVDDVDLGVREPGRRADRGHRPVRGAGRRLAGHGARGEHRRQCGSSQQSVHFAAAGLIAASYDLVVAGGVESMSRVPMGSTVQVAGSPFARAGGSAGTARSPRTRASARRWWPRKWGLSRGQLDE